MADPYNWQWENNINSGNELIDIDSPQEHKYNAWRTNLSLSNFRDCLPYSNQMNLNHHLSNKMQYHYLFHSIRKQKRYGKKKTDHDKQLEKQLQLEHEKLSLVQEHYKYNNIKAKQALMLLTDKQLDIIRQKQEKGG